MSRGGWWSRWGYGVTHTAALTLVGQVGGGGSAGGEWAAAVVAGGAEGVHHHHLGLLAATHDTWRPL